MFDGLIGIEFFSSRHQLYYQFFDTFVITENICKQKVYNPLYNCFSANAIITELSRKPCQVSFLLLPDASKRHNLYLPGPHGYRGWRGVNSSTRKKALLQKQKSEKIPLVKEGTRFSMRREVRMLIL